MVVLLVSCATTAGLVLGLLDALAPGPFGIVTVVAAYSLFAVWEQGDRGRRGPPTVHPGVAIGAVLALVIGIALAAVVGWTGQSRPLADGYESAHVLVAEQAARSRTLDHPVGFTDDISVANDVAGMVVIDGLQTVDAPRGFTAILTAARWSGGRGIPIVMAVLAGLFVFLVYLLAAQRLRPATALLVATASGLSPVLWLAVRGVSPALLAAVVTVGGLWLFVMAASEGSILQGAVAGFVLGSAALISFEGWYVPVAAAAFLVFEESGSWHDSLVLRRRTRRLSLAAVAATIPPLVLAGIDREMIGRLNEVLVVFVPLTAAVVGLGAVMRLLWNTGVRPGFTYLREAAVLVAVVLASAAAYRILRDPASIESVTEAAVQLAVGTPVDALPESVARHLIFGWLRESAGLITLLLGAIGLVWMGLTSLSTRDPGLRVPMIALILAGGLTLARPRAVPVMPDGLGVLLPVVIPGLLVGAGFLVDHWWSRRDLAVAGAVVAAVALLVVPGWRLRDVALLQPQDGAYEGVVDICDRLPPDAALLVIAGPTTPDIGRLLAPAVGAVCDVPAAYGDNELSAAAFVRYRGLAGDAGKSLYVIATEPFPLGEDGPAVAKTGDFTFEGWVRTITQFPSDTQLVSWPIGIAPGE